MYQIMYVFYTYKVTIRNQVTRYLMYAFQCVSLNSFKPDDVALRAFTTEFS